MHEEHSLILIMRRGLAQFNDHVQAIRDLAIPLHLVAADGSVAEDDPRFPSVTTVPDDASGEAIATVAADLARVVNAVRIITFNEADIEIAEKGNKALGLADAAFAAAQICRDKALQRAFLDGLGVPSVWYHPVSAADEACSIAAEHGFPVIVKPTRAASSEGVELVGDARHLRGALHRIGQMVSTGRKHYYDRAAPQWALIEEYLPGNEITVDGLVLDGQFLLGGVHHKAHSSGPYFAEDLYTLPFEQADREEELTDITQRIINGLNVRTCLFNIEMREDQNGRFKPIEFSIRCSGGHVYRHIKDVYSIDLVRMYARACRGEKPAGIRESENLRKEPRAAVCAKVIYGNGRIVRNNAGTAGTSPYYRAYYPISKPGSEVHCGAEGVDYVGTLSVWCRWRPGQCAAVVQRMASDLAGELDVVIDGQP